MGNRYDLSVEFCGIPLPNPFLLASAPPTAAIEMIRRAFDEGWGGVVTKTIVPDELEFADASPRFNVVKQDRKIIGFENFELVSKHNLEYWCEGIRSLRKDYPDRGVIASIMGMDTEKSWADLAVKMENCGAQALELNFSCPHGMPEMGGGAAIGQHADITARITGWVKKAVSIPVIAKLSPNVTSIEEIAQAAVEAGADALAAINTVESLTGIDLETLQPKPTVNGFSTYGGYSGAAVKPIGLRVVSQIARAVDVPILGMGGISKWQDAAEYIAVGSTAVQLCTEVMLKGFGVVGPLKEGLGDYLARKDWDLSYVCGKAVDNLTSHEALDKKGRQIPEIDTELCIGCGKCVTACLDGGYQALILSDKKKASLLEGKCDGCSLCSHVCPVEAIKMVSDTGGNEKKAV